MSIRHTIAWFLVFALSACVRSDVAPGVSPAGILSVELGMSREEVIGILGLPLAVNAGLNVHEGNCEGLRRPTAREVSTAEQITTHLDSIFSAAPCCEAIRRQQQEGRYTFDYSRMVEADGVSPMLWVHFDGNDRVREVYAKLNSRNALQDDKGIYMRNARGTYLMDKDLLEKYFTK